MPLSSNAASMSPASESPDRLTMDLWQWADLEDDSGSGFGGDSGKKTDRQARAEEEAYRRGLEEGKDSARASARAEFQDVLRATLAVSEEMRANRETWAAALTEHLAVLAAGVAGTVIGRAHGKDPTLFIELAERAVAAFPLEEAVRIRLHPHDRAILDNEDALMKVVGARGVQWIPDEDVVRGGCIVEGRDRIVDGRVDEALCRVINALTDD